MSDFDPLFAEAPDWLRKIVMEPRPDAPAAPAAPVVRPDSSAWPMLLEASVVGSFVPAELVPSLETSDARTEAEHTVLRLSELTRDESGVRWTLSRHARATILEQALATGEVKQAIGQTQQRFPDPVSRELRRCVQIGQLQDIGLSATDDLESRRTAVSLLSAVEGLSLPSLAELDHRIKRRRLIAQFERMIGRTASGERFYGRKSEMDALRTHARLSLSLGASIASFVSDNPFRVIFGLGGVGKTTLLARFMLEVAEAASDTFPFAYLDFDRSTLSARYIPGLLLEICDQVEAQFPDLDSQLDDVRTRVNHAAVAISERKDASPVKHLKPCIEQFVSAVDARLRQDEGPLSRSRPFLLVFDTFEVVQHSDDDVESIEEFTAAFDKDGRLWPRLRVVVSGRQRLEKFVRDVTPVEIGPLERSASIQMVVDLAEAAGKPLTGKDAERLVAAVASVAGDASTGVPPLRLRLISDLLQKFEGDGRAAVDIIVDELASLDPNSLTARTLIDGVLGRRVLEHIADWRVRALSDPGLVVRRITPDVIQHVMAQGTPLPVEAGGAPDGTSNRSWVIDEDEAEKIFEAFTKEVTLINREENGKALRHRPDLRRDMLPLIRARSQSQVTRLHELAFAYFSRLAGEEPGDLKSRAEAIYHGLWLAKPLGDIEALWPETDLFDHKIDEREFPDDSAASVYLRAKAFQPLATGELRQLPKPVALTWLDRRSSELLAERRIDRTIKIVRTVAGEEFGELDTRPDTAAVVARLLLRAGLWGDCAALARRHLMSAEPTGFPQHPRVSMLRTYVTMLSKSGTGLPKGHGEFLTAAIAPIDDPVIQIELRAHRILLESSLGNRAGAAAQRSELRQWVDNMSFASLVREPRVQRLGILAMRTGMDRYYAEYLAMLERLPRDPDLHSTLVALFESAAPNAPAGEEARKLLATAARRGERAYDQLDRLWYTVKPAVQGMVEAASAQAWADLARRIVIFDHADWHWVLGNALSRELDRHGEDRLSRVPDGRKWFSARETSRRRGDGLRIVQAASDVGQFLAMARALAEMPTGETATEYPQDVFALARALTRWHENLLKPEEPS